MPLKINFCHLSIGIWILLFLLTAFRYVRIKRRDIRLINRYTERLFPHEEDYARMLRGTEWYLLLGMLLHGMMIILTLSFPKNLIPLLCAGLYALIKKISLVWYRQAAY